MVRTESDSWDLATSVGATAHSGIRQAVIMAAGLDARAYRLPWPADTVVYEVDLPEVIEFKTATLGKLGAEPRAERRTVGVDLRDDWPAALRSAGFDPHAATTWSAEGLVVYLPTQAQDALFDNITALSIAGSQLACEFVPDTGVFADERWRTHHERMSELGFDIDFNELVYQAEPHHRVPGPPWLAGFAPHGRTTARRQRLRLPR